MKTNHRGKASKKELHQSKLLNASKCSFLPHYGCVVMNADRHWPTSHVLNIECTTWALESGIESVFRSLCVSFTQLCVKLSQQNCLNIWVINHMSSIFFSFLLRITSEMIKPSYCADMAGTHLLMNQLWCLILTLGLSEEWSHWAQWDPVLLGLECVPLLL